MTNEQAIEVINGHIKDSSVAYGTFTGQALHMAVEALKAQLSQEGTTPSTTPTTADTISRQAAIRWVKTECNPYGKPTLDFESGKRVMKHLEQMPPAQPEPERTMEEFMYGQDMGNPEDGSL